MIRLLWSLALVSIRLTPGMAPIAVGGRLPLTIAFWPKPCQSFVLTLRSSDASIADVPQQISGRADCSNATVMIAARQVGDADITVCVTPTNRFGPVLQKIACRLSGLLGLGNGRNRVTVGCPPILVIAPHPDDEALMASGVIANALASDQPVKVALVTNGDHRRGDISYGLKRQAESISAMRKVGLQNADLIFLGYPGDVMGLLRMMNNYVTADTAYTSAAGVSVTYGTAGFGNRDFHSWLTGKPAAYNATNLRGDLETLIRAWRPVDIYTTSRFDEHPDHRAVYYFVARAVQCVRLEDPSYAPTLHTAIIHDVTSEPYEDFWRCDEVAPARSVDFSGDDAWPLPARSAVHSEEVRFDPSICFSEPPNLERTGLRWSDVEGLRTPPSMHAPAPAENLKYQVLASYASQPLYSLAAFCKQDEIFWKEYPPASELLVFPPVQLKLQKDEAAVLAVTLIKPAKKARAIALTSSDESIVVVPAAVVVPSGAVTAVFAVKGVAAGKATLSARLQEQFIVAHVTVSGSQAE